MDIPLKDLSSEISTTNDKKYCRTGYLEGTEEENLIELENWWGNVHRLYRIGGRSLDDLKQALFNDVQAWGIISALIMTMGISLLTVGSSNVYDQSLSSNSSLLTTFVCFTLLSSLSSLAAIVFASNDYVFWNAIPADYVPRAMLWRYSHVSQWERFFLWMILSWFFLYIGVTALIKVLYGTLTFIVAIIVGAILFFYIVLRNFYLLGKNIDYYNHVSITFQNSDNSLHIA